MKNILLNMLLLFLLSGCEEVVVLDLKNTEPQLVVEANVDAGAGTCLVKLSLTDDFYSENEWKVLGNAEIQLIKENGEIIGLTETIAGSYFAEGLVLASGTGLKLRISAPNYPEILSDEVMVPPQVPLEKLEASLSATGGGLGGQASETTFTLTASWTDPAGMSNYYRLKFDKNDLFQSDLLILADDRLGDGEKIMRPVLKQGFMQGDTVRCRLLSVNKAYHSYFSDVLNSSGRGLSSPSPFNPQGNLPQPVLGYFGVWQSSEQVILVE